MPFFNYNRTLARQRMPYSRLKYYAPARRVFRKPRYKYSVRKNYISKKTSVKTSGAELKFFDTVVTSGATTAGAMIDMDLSGITQGTSDTQRIGRKINLKKIQYRFLVSKNPTTTLTTAGILRFMILVDHQCNGTQPAVLDILETAGFQSFRNLANKDRFTTLLDRNYALNYQAGGPSSTTTTTFAEIQHYDFWSTKADFSIPIEYDANTGAIGDLTSNNLVFLLIGEVTDIIVTGQIRYRFTDS